MNAEFETFSKKPFKEKVDIILKDSGLVSGFRGATNYLVDRRKASIVDPNEFEQLRFVGEAIKQRVLSKLPQLLEQLETNCQNNGITVHWAATPDEANQIIESILKAADVNNVVKGKSMVTEEIEMNHHLDSVGIDCIECDMGEYIIQIAEETPSHIIIPAIHKTKQQIAELFDHFHPDEPYTEDVDALIGAARKVLRDKFKNADAGISGVNFAVADSGTLCLVENEGNGRMVTTVPPLHIAVTGIEKVVETLSDVPPLLSLLTRSATGQNISTYFNMISSPRKSDEKDGPEAVHLVLVDNGRSDIYQNPHMRSTLQCIRCGSCMNHCPVYSRIGGHAYGTTYPGPIGQALTPQQLGLQQDDGKIDACTLNGACYEACPVRIPLPELIRNLRSAAVNTQVNSGLGIKGQGSQRHLKETLIWRVWSIIHRVPALYRFGTNLAHRLRFLQPKKMGPWTQTRTMPKLAKKSLHQLIKDR